ncbi:DUF1433 domain-containing protein [Sediminibacillus dalangtanensis]|uniref:DUF1433 domain-containing protein n=1 Tax=Sediminibacillus dalangtanensis TaxID=2729421 RepID=A0ABX7VV82_9BACI|nr:DUF1433 domain-containing protein [Sediminibacillus dalangtanensis]QTM98247.1 DUF1433 domain-containing protein [Sediminibacillus dalangtanensis]
MNSNKNNFDEETINQAKETAESYLKNNYENIQTIEFNDDHNNPMGGIMIRGIVNGEAGFSVSVDPKNFVVNSVGEKKGFPDRKDECREKSCDY